MLPEFPWFKPIDLSDRPAVEAMIAGYPPFADFNFVELWCWNRGQHGGIAALDGNLVVRWEDVITGELFLSFIGTNKVERTAEKLIAYAKERGIEPRLQAVPGVVVDSGPGFGNSLVVEEDVHNSDYLLSVSDWVAMSGSRFKNKRNAIHRLERHHHPRLERLDLSDASIRKEIMALCQTWADQRNRTAAETEAEFAAIENLLDLAQELELDRLVVLGAYTGDQLIGFSINEILPDDYALGHFAKADYRFEGVYPYMLSGLARILQDAGVRYLNIEADLGDPGLAISKKLCSPAGRLRKFVIAESSDLDLIADPRAGERWAAARTA
ncbi:MAG: GNAT family N-acetyltransferase [Thermomicrobiales bacterium]|nr:GNAT family N-acetyltransferase [Thermomicrobiales bacterium]